MDIFTLLMLDKHLQLNVNFQKKTDSQKLSCPKNIAQYITGAAIIVILPIVITYLETSNSESSALTKEQGESVMHKLICLMFFISTCLFLCWNPGNVLAEEKHVLDDIVVTSIATASGAVKKLPYAPASVTIITKEELVAEDVVSLADALKGIEGITIYGGRKSGSISIRGMQTNATLILIDGKRLNSGFSDKANGMSEGLEVNNIPPIGAIERIEIIRGPMSALYGSDAIGGVINIITKKTTVKWSGSVGASGTWPQDNESGDSYQGDFYASGPIAGDKLSAKIWGFKKYHEEDEIENGFRQSDRQGLSGTLTFTPGARNSFNATLGHIDQDMESTEGLSSSTTQSVDYDFDSYAVGYKGTYNSFEAELNAYYKDIKRNGTNESWYPETKNSLVDGKLVLPMTDDYLTAGFQWKRDETTTQAGYKSPGDIYGRSSGMTEKALFAEYEWAMTKEFTLTAGARLQDNEYYGSHYTFRCYGVFVPAESWSIKGGYAGGYINPTLRETDPDIGNPQSWRNPRAYTYGNPDLLPEESDNFELGVYFTPGKSFSFNTTVFDIEYKNKIINTGRTEFLDADGNVILDSEGYIWGTYLNIGEATVRGLELAFEFLPVKSVVIRGNYTYTDSTMDASDAVVRAANGDIIVDWRFLEGKPLLGVPENKINMYVEWQINRKFSINTNIDWHDSESKVDWSKTISKESDYKMWDESLLTIDVGAGYQMTDMIRIFAKIYNVNNETRSSDADYTYLEEGRRYWMGLRVDF